MNKWELENQSRINNIQSSSFHKDELILLIHNIRDESTKKGLIREIGDFIHPKREKGLTYDLTKMTLASLIIASKNGGTFSVKPLTNYSLLITELCKELKRQGYKLDEQLFQNNKKNICEIIIDHLDGTILDLKLTGYFTQCKLKAQKVRPDDLLSLMAVSKPDGNVDLGSIKLKENVSIGFCIIAAEV